MKSPEGNSAELFFLWIYFAVFFWWLLSAASCQRTSTAQIMSHIWLYGLKPSQDFFFFFWCFESIFVSLFQTFLAQRQFVTQAVETWDQTTNPLITGHLLFNLLRLLQTITHPIDVCVLLGGLFNRSIRTHSLPLLSTHWIMQLQNRQHITNTFILYFI